jgi:ribonuclease HI
MTSKDIVSFFTNKNSKNEKKLDLNDENTNYTLYFDGCSKGNPGKSGAGAVIYKDNNEIWGNSIFVGNNNTNNESEYSGLIFGLEKAKELNIANLDVKGDSMIVIKQMLGVYKVKSEKLQSFNKKAKSIATSFINISYQHVYRDLNKRADQLSNEGLLKSM